MPLTAALACQRTMIARRVVRRAKLRWAGGRGRVLVRVITTMTMLTAIITRVVAVHAVMLRDLLAGSACVLGSARRGRRATRVVGFGREADPVDVFPRGELPP